MGLSGDVPTGNGPAEAQFRGTDVVAPARLGWYDAEMLAKAVATLASISLLLGCASTSSQLLTRFSKTHRCQESLVRVSEAGANEYVAEGCGYRTRYVCGSFTSDKSCVEQGVVPQAGTEPPKRAPGPGFEDPPK